MSNSQVFTRVAVGALATLAVTGVVLAGSGAVAAAAPSQPVDPLTAVTPLSQSNIYRVNPILNPDDVLYTNKYYIVGPGAVFATSVDGRTFRFYRVVGDARSPMSASAPVCLPTGFCHSVLFDDPGAVI